MRVYSHDLSMKFTRKIMARTWLLGLSLVARTLFGADYHVDPLGDDARDGLTESTAWRTLGKVNRTTFRPGDRILLKSGGEWRGQLAPRGSGSREAPITLDRYGGDARPVIHGEGQTEGTIKLLNLEFWEIRHLEVTNRGAAQGQYVGIKVRNCTGRELHRVTIEHCVVRDINGYASGFYGANAGIAVVADMNNSTWCDVTIADNEVHDVDRVGIFVGPTWQVGGSPDWLKEPRTEHVVIRGNSVWNLGGDGILSFLTNHTLIEHNVVFETGRSSYAEATGPKNPTGYSNAASAAIWNVLADDTTMQFNEVYRCLAGLDGEAFDIDMGTNGTLVQYNYSHDNLGGFLLLCESAGPADINNAVVRFNISQSDGLTKGVFHVGQPGFPPGPDKTEIFNNTIYVPAHAKPDVKLWRPYGMKKILGEARIYNNVFFVLGEVSYPEFDRAEFSHNIFYGVHPSGEPADAFKITSDPLLVAPGSATLGLGSADGYKLRTGSPALGSGLNTGTARLGPRDYWGNAVPAAGPVNRGADNGAGVTGAPLNWAFHCKVTSSSEEARDGWSTGRVVDGQRSSTIDSRGFSTARREDAKREETVTLDFGVSRRVSQVTVYPCAATSGDAGGGFPRRFEIQVWQNEAWQTRATSGEWPEVVAQAQTLTLSSAAETARIRIRCTELGRIEGGFAVRFAEIEAGP